MSYSKRYLSVVASFAWHCCYLCNCRSSPVQRNTLHFFNFTAVQTLLMKGRGYAWLRKNHGKLLQQHLPVILALADLEDGSAEKLGVPFMKRAHLPCGDVSASHLGQFAKRSEYVLWNATTHLNYCSLLGPGDLTPASAEDSYISPCQLAFLLLTVHVFWT